MKEPTRLEVINKLETIKDLTQSAMYSEMSTWFQEHSNYPERLLDDLNSYSIYANAKK